MPEVSRNVMLILQQQNLGDNAQCPSPNMHVNKRVMESNE